MLIGLGLLSMLVTALAAPRLVRAVSEARPVWTQQWETAPAGLVTWKLGRGGHFVDLEADRLLRVAPDGSVERGKLVDAPYPQFALGRGGQLAVFHAAKDEREPNGFRLRLYAPGATSAAHVFPVKGSSAPGCGTGKEEALVHLVVGTRYVWLQHPEDGEVLKVYDLKTYASQAWKPPCACKPPAPEDSPRCLCALGETHDVGSGVLLVSSATTYPNGGGRDYVEQRRGLWLDAEGSVRRQVPLGADGSYGQTLDSYGDGGLLVKEPKGIACAHHAPLIAKIAADGRCQWSATRESLGLGEDRTLLDATSNAHGTYVLIYEAVHSGFPRTLVEPAKRAQFSVVTLDEGGREVASHVLGTRGLAVGHPKGYQIAALDDGSLIFAHVMQDAGAESAELRVSRYALEL